MIVGVIEGQDSVGDVPFKIAERHNLTDNTATFTLKTIDGLVVDNLKHWYNDPEMIGRHFLVYSKDGPRIKRQYTICSSMNKTIMNTLLDLAKTVLEGKV